MTVPRTLSRYLIVAAWSLFFFVTSAQAIEAQTCASIGGTCRPGWISGCALPEAPASGTCPSDPNGALICCTSNQTDNACTQSGGACRSDYYSNFFPAEPACGYDPSANVSSSACSGPGQLCCVPAPNTGAACNGTGTCQLSGNCANGTEQSSSACIGGAVCCVPTPPNTGTSCNSSGGTCQFAASCGGTAQASGLCTGGTVCCTPIAPPPPPPPPNTGTSCNSSGGTCQMPGNCQGLATSSGTCVGGSICCSPQVGAACTSQDSGNTGTCRLSCIAGETGETPDAPCAGGICCIPPAPGPPPPPPANQGATCAGDISGLAGVCEFTDQCSNYETSGVCTGGTQCCIVPPPPPPPTATACVGENVGTLGACTAQSNCPSTNTDTSANCQSGEVCCLTVAPNVPGPGNPNVPGPGNPNVPGPGNPNVPGPGNPGGILNFANPLAFNDINSFVTAFLIFLQRFLVTISVIFIIIGAFIYITSAGDTGRVELAKKAIGAALIGLALGIAAPAFLREIGTILGWTPNLPAGVGTSLGLLEITRNVLNFLLSIVGVIALIMLIIGGFMYLTAAGDEGRIDTAKKIVMYSIIGITVALASMVLVRQVALFFQ